MDLLMSRRELLKATLVAPAVAAVAGAMEKKTIPVAVQLYSIRQAAPKDLAGSLTAIKEMGYDGVEFAGYYGKSAEELKKLLDEAGLKCCGTHTGLNTLQGDALKKTAEFNLTLGNPYLIVPSLPKQTTAQGWLDLAKTFNDRAVAAKELGCHVGYHAHAGDFQKVEEQVPWFLFFDNTNQEVLMQLDTGNCLGGGADPIEILKKYPGRSQTVHLKEHGGPRHAVIGEGVVKWAEVLEICATIGDTKWYIIEHESTPDTLDGIKRSREGLRQFGV